MSKLTICIYGAASDTLDASYIRDGVELGLEIGKRKHAIIYGGGSTGLMGAVAKGAHELNAEITGVAPHFMKKFELLYSACTDFIFTDTMAERKQIMEDRSDAFIICPGGVGTMDEFFQILTLVSLEEKSAPIVIYNSNGIYDKLIAFLEESIEAGFIQPSIKSYFFVSKSPVEIMDFIERTAESSAK